MKWGFQGFFYVQFSRGLSAITDYKTKVTTVTAEVVNLEDEDTTATVEIFAYDEDDEVEEVAEVTLEDVAIEEGAIEVEVDVNGWDSGDYVVVVTVSEVVEEEEVEAEASYDFTLDFEAVDAAVDAVNDAVAANNQINLLAALDNEWFENVNEDKIADYRADLNGEALADRDTVAKIQDIIDARNEAASEEDAKIAAVDAVDAANTQPKLATALSDELFERYNSDYIVAYWDALVTPYASDPTVAANFDPIQTMINEVNNAQAVEALEALFKDFDADLIAPATASLEWLEDQDTETVDTTDDNMIDGDYDKDQTAEAWLEDIAEYEAVIAVVNAADAENAEALTTAFALLDEQQTGTDFDIDTVLADFIDDYVTAIEGEGTDADKNTPAEIQDIINGVNGSFDKYVVQDATVEASDEAAPEFTIKALAKDGTAFVVNEPADLITVAIGESGDLAYQVKAGGNDFTDAPLSELTIVPNAINFNLPTVGEVVEATIKFTVDGEAQEVNGQLTVIPGVADETKTKETMELDKEDGEYVSGESVTITFTLRDSAENVLTAENGTYAAELTVGQDTFYRNLTFVEGSTSVTVPARTVTIGAEDVVVEVEPEVASGSLTLTMDASDPEVTGITIVAGDFSELEIGGVTDTVFEITATDGINAITDFGTKLTNIQVVDEDDEPVEVANTDFEGNVSASYTAGVYTHTHGLGAGRTYTVTVTVGDITVTRNIVVPYVLTLEESVSGAAATLTGAGIYVEGQVADINVTANSGYVLQDTVWTGTLNNGTLGNASNADTTFTMGNADTTITANFNVGGISAADVTQTDGNSNAATTITIDTVALDEGSIIELVFDNQDVLDGGNWSEWGTDDFDVTGTDKLNVAYDDATKTLTLQAIDTIEADVTFDVVLNAKPEDDTWIDGAVQTSEVTVQRLDTNVSNTFNISTN